MQSLVPEQKSALAYLWVLASRWNPAPQWALALLKAVPLYFGILFSPNGVEKMIGLWYNAVNLLEGELFDDAFK